MRSRKLLLGLLILGLLGVVAAVALVAGQEILAGVALIALVFAVGVLVLDAATTLRRTERELQKLAKRVRAAAPATGGDALPPAAATPVTPPAAEADLLGTIRLLQAQYVGRLDRAEAKLDLAVDRLSATDGHQE